MRTVWYRIWLVFGCAYVLLLARGVWAESQPAFWKVSDKDSSVYLLGSMHFGTPDFYPLPKAIEQAYDRASLLAVELDITNIDPVTMTAAMQKYGVLPEGKQLKDVLKPSLYKKLQQYCTNKGMVLETWALWQPWFVAIQLVQFELAQSSYKASLGIDMYFLSKKDKPVFEIETVDSQLGLFAGFSDSEQALFVEQTLEDLKQSKAFLDVMAAAWKSGDMDQLEQIMVAPFLEGGAAGESFFAKFFTDRNVKMADAIEQFLNINQSAFVVVGAGHMVGEIGLISLLTKRGFKVEREGKGGADRP